MNSGHAQSDPSDPLITSIHAHLNHPSSSLITQTGTSSSPAIPTDDDVPGLSTAPEDSDTEDNSQITLSQRGIFPDSSAVPLSSLENGDDELTRIPAPVPLGQPPASPSNRTEQTTSGRSRANISRRRTYPDSDAESTGSMPSLQTVSDSSDESEWMDEDSEDDEEEDEDGDDDEDGEGEFDDGGLLNILPDGSIPTLSARVMEQLSRAVSEGLADEDEDERVPYTPLPFEVFGPGPTRAMHAEIPGALADIMRQALDSIGGPAIPDSDPIRAEMIVKACEVVPEEFVRRYEKLRAGLDGEQCEGCAVCRESFLDTNVDESAIVAHFAELPYPDGQGADETSPPVSNVVVFPCPGKHLFHSGCLKPWLGRKTTCPTCRYDVDPESLTLSVLRDLRRRSGHPQANKQWAPPKGRGFRRWLEREEKKLQIGEAETDSDEMPSLAETSEDEDDNEPVAPLPHLAPTSNPTSSQSRSASDTTNRTASRSSNRNTSHNPFTFGRPGSNSDTFYSVNSTMRDNVMAALLPMFDREFGLDENTSWNLEEDEELPELIPVRRPMLPVSAPNFPSRDRQHDEELPDLINEPRARLQSSFRPVQPALNDSISVTGHHVIERLQSRTIVPTMAPNPLIAHRDSGRLDTLLDSFPPNIREGLALFSHYSHTSGDDDDGDDDDMPGLEPVAVRASAQPSISSDSRPSATDDDDELPELVNEPASHILEDID